MNRRPLYAIGLALLAAGLLPLRDGRADSCCTATLAGYDMKSSSLTRSLAAGVQQPVNGDEEFFNATASTGPTAPSSIVFLLDNSGSMTDLPQCSSGWNKGSCTQPSVTTPANPTGGSYLPTVNGSCSFTGTAAWMTSVTPTSTYPDTGYNDGSGYLKDLPPWSGAPNGTCSGNNCLFQPANVYQYGNWDETSATPENGDGCTLYSGATPQKDVYGNVITAGSACTTCLANKGVYVFTVRYVTQKTPKAYANWSDQIRFTGAWLNANPPKYISARKAVKSLIRIDPTSPKLRDKVRYGLTTFWNTNASGTDLDNGNGGDTTGIKKGDGATLLVPLGPDCATTTTAGYVQDRQAIIDAINATGNSKIRFNNYTPLAEALFNIAQYFSQPGGTGAHDVRFTSTWDKAGTPGGISYWAGQDFRQSSPGAIGATKAPWASSADQKSICWSCQVSSAIIVTDGMPNNESGLPAAGVSANHATNPNGSGKWDFQKWTPTAYASSANCGANRGATGDKCNSFLPLVALYLNTYDMIPDTTFAAMQNVIVHAISFGVTDAQALATLQATANLGGGKFANTTSTSELEDALVKAVNNVVARQTAFSSANANALQTNRNQASETYFARFKPDTTPSWQGHLIQGMLFDEFAMGCDVTKKYADDTSTVNCGTTTHKPNFNGDTDASGFNRCDGVFLVDQNCKEMTERGTDGAFVLADDIDTLATVPWDAGAVLCNPNGAYVGATNPCASVNASYLSAADDTSKEPTPTGKPIRKIYTWLGSTGLTEFKTTDATGLSALEKAMALDQPFCQQLLTDAAACVSGVCHTSATWVQADTDQCAKLVIYYVRGFDVFDLNGDGCRSPVNSIATCANGQERAWKLGDIFHSTPAVVKPPAHEDLCDSGYDTQCVATIHSPSWLGAVTTQTTIDYPTGGVDAYATWRNANVDRQRVVLVGANDGMLHAFDAGSAVSGTRDSFGSLPYSSGTGKELWAFIPPDLLPRLKLLLYGHEYMVDGSTMVRDVWVDGGATGAGTKDSIKQQNEFHTLAVVSERSGGTQFVGLDVSDPVNPPRFLWTFPPPCGDDARWMAESWTDFAPRAPPIGPVKIKSSASRGFDEKWVVMLNGGYDPAMVKGRAVFMVDAWSGSTVWRFTDDDVKTLKGSGTPVAMFPVPASVGLVDIGDPSTATFSRDGFFDTATWGDMGGNLWVSRFWEPGDTGSGLVNNWYASRAFEEQRRTSDDKMMVDASGTVPTGATQVRSPFFYMTANAWESQTHTLRTFVGSGNREQMMQKGAACGPDNVTACIQSGCTKVETRTVDAFGACTETQHMLYQDGLYSFDSSTSGTCGATLVCAAPTSNVYTGTTTFDFTCGGTTYSTVKGTLTCNASGVCSAYSEVGPGKQVTTGLVDSQFHDRLYGIWSYGGTGASLAKKTFRVVDGSGNVHETLAAAKTFDANRFTDVSFTGTCGGGSDGAACKLVDVTWANVTYDPDNPSATVTNGCLASHSPCQPTAADPGWFYEYGQVCQQSTCSPAPPWSDERTASGANVVLGCASWSGFRPTAPTGTTTTTDVCTAVPASTSSYSYLSDFVTGLPTRACGFSSNGTIYRSYERNTWSPPSTASARVTFNAQGQVSYSVLNLDPGQPPGHTTIGVQEVGADPVYELEVSREAHRCRHADGANCE